MIDNLDQNGKAVNWPLVEAVIFDVDGTLYRQRPVRIRMALRMAGFLLLHPREIKIFLGIWHFRKLRESCQFQAVPLETQILEAAHRSGISDVNRLREAIQLWMFQKPLDLIRENGNQPVLDLLKGLRAEGKRILIYSDYAPEEKLAALEVVPDAVYYPGCNGIEELKPSGKSIRTILADQGLSAAETVYIGDRVEKDGESAFAVGMRFVWIKP